MTTKHSSNKNLKCAICHHVYVSPRILPCIDTFCLGCIEDLIKSNSESFNCPQCQKDIPVPSDGAAGFPRNRYISDEELESARRGPVSMCSVHGREELDLFCQKCSCCICIKCKLTKHDNHKTEDLFETAGRSVSRLKRSRSHLRKTIDLVEKKCAVAEDLVSAVKQKRLTIEEQVHAHHDILVRRVGEIRDEILKEVEETSNNTEKSMADEIRTLRQNRDSLLHLRQRVHHTLCGLEASDAEKVVLEKEISGGGEGSKEHLDRVKKSLPAAAVRPGLYFSETSVSDKAVREYLGSPFTITVPMSCSSVSETVIPIYQCGKRTDMSREVHSLCCLVDKQKGGFVCASFGGVMPDYVTESVLYIKEDGSDPLPAYHPEPGAQGVKRIGRYLLVPDTHGKRHYKEHFDKKTGMYTLASHHGAFFQLSWQKSSDNSCYVSSLTGSVYTVIGSNGYSPVAFDEDNGEVFAIIMDSSVKGRDVCLYNKNGSKPFSVYKPSDVGFVPSDVCFWTENGKTKLLISDAQNDNIHVVIIDDDQCCFERYLAVGNGFVFHPTALDVDEKNRVWIGCQNGWILRCETVLDQKESKENLAVDSDELPADIKSVSSNRTVIPESFAESDSSGGFAVPSETHRGHGLKEKPVRSSAVVSDDSDDPNHDSDDSDNESGASKKSVASTTLTSGDIEICSIANASTLSMSGSYRSCNIGSVVNIDPNANASQ